MKKFLLLLVGVLFALSADAWTLYFDIKDTGWKSAPYIYCGKLKGSTYDSGATYYNKYQLTQVYGTIYKWGEQEWNGLTTIFISETDLGNPTNTDLTEYATKLNGTNAYGQFTTASGDNWTLKDKRLYVLGSRGNNGASAVTDDYIAYSLRGDFTSTGGSYTWENNDYPFKPQEDGKTYIYDLSSIGTLKDGQTFKIYNITESTWYGQSEGAATISKDASYTLGTSGDIKVSGDISNPVFTLVVEGKTHTLTISEQSVTPGPTPVVKTAYTIYFDTFQSGWRNVTLLNEGVEVVGSLVKAGYIHGAKEDGVEGYLHKYTVNTTDATKLTFTNGTASYTLSTITDGNVYYVSASGLADAPHASYKVNAAASYRLHGQILGDDGWETYKMTYFDGLWIYEADNFVAGNFGIKKLGVDEAVDKSSTSPNPWIYAVTTDKNAHHVVIGATTNCALEGSEQATEKSGNFYSSVKGKYTLVFDPEAMTVMFINPAVAATATATVEPVSTTSHANKLSVTIKVSDYSSVIGGYALSNGTFTAVSTENTFANVPYASNYTLTVGSASMPIDIAMPAEPTFDIKAINATTFAPAAGQNKGILSVAFTVETTWAYNLPHVICTCNGVVVPGNVEWSTNGFTFSAAEAVPLDGNAIKTDMTFKFVITPEYPFIVNSASPRGQMRVSGTGYQTVLGTAITNAEATLKGGNKVSGVEGVVIEAEDAPVEYYNLQGQRVNGDLAPGIYIRRQGTTVTKVRI